MAVNTFTNGAGGNTWNTAGNWSQGTIPTVSDGHVTTFDASSPNCTMGAARSCNNIDFTNYTNTLTMSTFTLTVAGNITLDSAMNISGTGALAASKTGGGTCTFTSNGFTWPNNLSAGGSGGGSWTITLVGDLTVTGVVSQGGAHAVIWNKTTSEKIYANGGLTIGINSTTGSLDFVLGGGTWSMTASNGWPNNTEIAGNVTISGNIYYRVGTLLYTSGTVTTTSSTLNLKGSCTLDTFGIDWNNVITDTTSSLTYTINSTLSVTGTLTLGIASQTFAGTAGWTTATLSCLYTGALTVSLKEAVTYTITSSFACSSSRVGAIVLFTSSHASTKALIYMPNNGSNLCNVLASFTRIDASGGRSICTFGGVLTDTVNIVQYYDYNPVAL